MQNICSKHKIAYSHCTGCPACGRDKTITDLKAENKTLTEKNTRLRTKVADGITLLGRCAKRITALEAENKRLWEVMEVLRKEYTKTLQEEEWFNLLMKSKVCKDNIFSRNLDLEAENKKLKDALKKICSSSEIMEARRFARESLEKAAK